MIDSISTSSVQSSALRSSPQSVTALPVEEIQISSVSTPTWRIRVDNNLNRAIIEVRSSETGQVIRQYPTDAQLKAFARAEALKAARQHAQNAELNAKLAGARPEASTPDAKVSAPQASPSASSAPAPDNGSAGGSTGGQATTQSIEV